MAEYKTLVDIWSSKGISAIQYRPGKWLALIDGTFLFQNDSMEESYFGTSEEAMAFAELFQENRSENRT